MALTHRHSHTVRSNAGSVTSAAYTITGTAEANIELEDLAISTNRVQDFAADVSTIVSLAIEWNPSTGSSSASIFTNEASSGSPDDTLTILAGKPLVWDTQMLATTGVTCPLTVDVDGGLFITTTVAGDLYIYVLFNGS